MTITWPSAIFLKGNIFRATPTHDTAVAMELKKLKRCEQTISIPVTAWPNTIFLKGKSFRATPQHGHDTACAKEVEDWANSESNLPG